MKNEFRISVSPALRETIEKLAAQKGLSPNMAARMLLHEHLAEEASGEKAYTVRLANWREVEAYAQAKMYGSVAALIPVALETIISRNPLTAAQKARVGRVPEISERGAFAVVLGASTGKQNGTCADEKPPEEAQKASAAKILGFSGDPALEGK